MDDGDSSAPATGGEAAGRCCDFCGHLVPRVQRVALDRDYERLQTPHPVRYACRTCSEEKERHRLGAPPR